MKTIWGFYALVGFTLDTERGRCIHLYSSVAEPYMTMAQTPSLQQRNVDHFNKHHLEPKPHMVALADRTVAQLTQQLHLSKDTVVLEFGCGTGLLSERLAPYVGRIYGVDIAPNAVEVYNSKAAAKGIRNMSAVCLDLLNSSDAQQAVERGGLPSTFNLICAHMVLHHVDDAAAVIAALAQRLQPKPPGELVLTDLFATERSKRFHGAQAHHTVSHPGGFPEEQISQLVHKAGLLLKGFDSTTLHVTKTVQQADGAAEAAEDFPIFVAVAHKAAG